MSAGVIEAILQRSPTVSVGALSANLMSLSADIRSLEENGAVLLHFDVMDGRFVPQFTVGPLFVKAVKTAMLKDVHLMMQEPFAVLPQFAAAGADIITVHMESCVHARACLQLIGTLKNANDEARGIMRGVALNPGTPIAVLEPLLDETDIVTIVGINPGFSRQTLYPDTAARAESIRRMVAESGRRILLCIDGGVTMENIRTVAAMKPDIVVSGSAIFANNAIAENLKNMTDVLKSKADKS